MTTTVTQIDADAREFLAASARVEADRLRVEAATYQSHVDAALAAGLPAFVTGADRRLASMAQARADALAAAADLLNTEETNQ